MPTIVAPPTARLTGDEYERLCKVGAFGDRRVELIGGRFVKMNPTYTLRAFIPMARASKA
jgi:hypothetical protein